MRPAPRSTLRSGLRTGWPFALAILAGAVPLGCYKPNIKDGGLKCNLDAGVGKSCPEGFKCDTSTLQRAGGILDGGVDRPSDAVDGPVDMQVMDDEARTSLLRCARRLHARGRRHLRSVLPDRLRVRQKCSVNTAGRR